MNRLSAVIITLNEEQNIAEAIESVQFADEIVVVDSGSSDRTCEIAKGLGARIVHQDWLGFGKQKQFAVEQCGHEWILSLDADERVTKELQTEIESIVAKDQEGIDGYRIPRKSIYMNRPILHSGWYPDYQLRLFKKRKGHWKDMAVHESVEMENGAEVAKLTGEILHYSVRSASEHASMITNRYGPLGARQMELNGVKTNVLKVTTAAPISFLRSYVLKLGFLDGLPGFCIAFFAGYAAFLKHLLRYESQSANDNKKKV